MIKLMEQIPEKRALPNPISILMGVVVLAAVSTWLLPAGQYSKLSSDAHTAFVLTSDSGTVSLPFAQKTLDSLSIKIPLEKFINGDIRKPVSVPGTYQRRPASRQGLVAVLQAPVKGVTDSMISSCLSYLSGALWRYLIKQGLCLTA